MSKPKTVRKYPGGGEFGFDAMRDKNFKCLYSFDTQAEAEEEARRLARNFGNTYRVRDKYGKVVFKASPDGSWSSTQGGVTRGEFTA